MPFIDERAPPVSAGTLENARRELPIEYGYARVDEGAGATLIVRVPRAKPDYNYELAVAALYVAPSDVKDLKHVILLGHSASVRMEPIRLRDHVREQAREDAEIAGRLRHSLPREFGWGIQESALNVNHRVLAIRLPIASLAQADDALVHTAREAMGPEFERAVRSATHVYLVADQDHGRLGRRVFVESLDPLLAETLASEHGDHANPLHLKYQTAGGTIR